MTPENVEIAAKMAIPADLAVIDVKMVLPSNRVAATAQMLNPLSRVVLTAIRANPPTRVAVAGKRPPHEMPGTVIADRGPPLCTHGRDPGHSDGMNGAMENPALGQIQ